MRFIRTLTIEAIHRFRFVLENRYFKVYSKVKCKQSQGWLSFMRGPALQAWIHSMPKHNLILRLCPPFCFTPIKICHVHLSCIFLRWKNQTEFLTHHHHPYEYKKVLRFRLFTTQHLSQRFLKTFTIDLKINHLE